MAEAATKYKNCMGEGKISFLLSLWDVKDFVIHQESSFVKRISNVILG